MTGIGWSAAPSTRGDENDHVLTRPPWVDRFHPRHPPTALSALPQLPSSSPSLPNPCMVSRPLYLAFVGEPQEGWRAHSCSSFRRCTRFSFCHYKQHPASHHPAEGSKHGKPRSPC